MRVAFPPSSRNRSIEDIDMSIVKEQGAWLQFRIWFLTKLTEYALNWRFFALFLEYWYGDQWKLRWTIWAFGSAHGCMVLMRMAGHRLERNLGFTPFMIKLALFGMSAAIFYKGVKSALEHIWPEEKVEENPPTIVHVHRVEPVTVVAEGPSRVMLGMTTPEVQGNTMSKYGSTPQIKDPEDEVVWYHNDPYVPCELDVSQQSRCAKNDNQKQILSKKVETNMATFHCFKTMDPKDKPSGKVGCAFNFQGSLWIVNKHSLLEPPFYLNIYRMEEKEGITTNAKGIRVTSDMILFISERDIAVIELQCLPPSYNLIEYFPSESLKGTFTGELIGRSRFGAIRRQRIYNLRKYDQPYPVTFSDGKRRMYQGPTWFGHVDVDTEAGQCGSLIQVSCGLGELLLGFHFLGGDRKETISIAISREELKLYTEHFKSPNYERGPIPYSDPVAPRELGPVNSKSQVLYTQNGVAHVFGSFTGFRPALKSNFAKTTIYKSAVKRGYVDNYAAPPMGYMPYWVALQDMVDPKSNMDTGILKECKEAFLNDILKKLSREELKRVCVYDDVTTMNGAAGVKFCNAINRNTSVGAPFNKSKRQFLVPIECEPGQEWVEYSPEIQARIDKVYEAYNNNKLFHPQFTAHLKDDPLSKKKAKAFKTRVFCGAEGAWAFVMRKYFLSIVELIQRNKYIFEACPGTSAQSADWHWMYKFLTHFGLEWMVAGDFRLFDKSMQALILRCAFEILIRLGREAGFSDKDVHIMQGLMLDTIHAFVDFNGTLIQFLALNPSGHPLTVIINGIVHSIYMRYCFVRLARKHAPNVSVFDFQKYVHLLTYGDDGVMGIDPSVKWFNHTSIQGELANIGVSYTMADKESESRPFISMDEVTFLKRSWRWEPELERYVGPLEEESIGKSLLVWIAKKTTNPIERDLDTMRQALREYFFYGREVFEAKRRMMSEIVIEHTEQYGKQDMRRLLEMQPFPTWEELVKTYWEGSKYIKPYVA